MVKSAFMRRFLGPNCNFPCLAAVARPIVSGLGMPVTLQEN
jgi:hypothetical protein